MAFGPCLASTAHGPPGSRASVTLTVGIGGQPHPPCTPQGPPESRTLVPPLQEALSPRGPVHCSGRGPPHSRDRPPPPAPAQNPQHDKRLGGVSCGEGVLPGRRALATWRRPQPPRRARARRGSLAAGQEPDDFTLKRQQHSVHTAAPSTGDVDEEVQGAPLSRTLPSRGSGCGAGGAHIHSSPRRKGLLRRGSPGRNGAPQQTWGLSGPEGSLEENPASETSQIPALPMSRPRAGVGL